MPIKIIITEDQDLKDSIILASNTQAAVDDYDMLARHGGLRLLQHTFERAEAPLRERVWFQRRRDEPIDWPSHWERVDWTRVVRPRHLLDAFAAAILGIPHVAHQTPGRILELARGGKVFAPGHEPTMYRALAWLVVTGRRWARRNNKRWQDLYVHSGPQAYPARHQYVYALWRLVDDEPDEIELSKISKSGAADQRFQKAIGRLLDDGDELGDMAGRAIEQGAAFSKERLDRELAQRKYFTAAVRKAVDEMKIKKRWWLGARR